MKDKKIVWVVLTELNFDNNTFVTRTQTSGTQLLSTGNEKMLQSYQNPVKFPFPPTHPIQLVETSSMCDLNIYRRITKLTF
jgi:hypothetical protein